jgi:hypothetical protein
MSKWGVAYLAQNYVQLWQGEKPTGKNIIGDDAVRLCYNYLASYADEKNNFECWVGIETQASEMRKDQRTVRRARAQLQQAGLMLDTGRRVGLAKVWQIVLPGFQEWFDENIKTGANAPDESAPVISNGTGAKRGAYTGAKRGAKRGANTGANSGALVSASAPQIEQEQEHEKEYEYENDPAVIEARAEALKATKKMLENSFKNKNIER